MPGSILDKEVLEKEEKNKKKVKSIMQAEPQAPPHPDTNRGSDVSEGPIEQTPDEPMDVDLVEPMESQQQPMVSMHGAWAHGA